MQAIQQYSISTRQLRMTWNDASALMAIDWNSFYKTILYCPWVDIETMIGTALALFIPSFLLFSPYGLNTTYSQVMHLGERCLNHLIVNISVNYWSNTSHLGPQGKYSLSCIAPGCMQMQSYYSTLWSSLNSAFLSSQ